MNTRFTHGILGSPRELVWGDLAEAIGILDDKYSFLLPHYDFVASVQPSHMVGAAKYAKPSAPGLDGWTHGELALVPESAWFDLMRVCVSTPESMLDSLTGVFRRVPLSKTQDSVPTPGELRPIDVFSAILRVRATALVNALRPWTLRIRQPAQHVFSAGVVTACSKIALATERASLGLCTLWGLSADFAKMFNTLSPHVAAAVARIMGLSMIP